jgi:hypothetical protein
VALLNSYVNMVFIIPEDEFYEKTESKRGMHRSRMSRVRRHWISKGKATGPGWTQAMLRQRTNRIDRIYLPVTAAPGEESWNIEREEIDAGDPRGLIVQQPENTLCCEVPVFWRP